MIGRFSQGLESSLQAAAAIRQLALLFDKLQHRRRRYPVALGTQSGDDRGRDLRNIGVVVIGLAFVNDRDVELDDRPLEHFQRIENRDRGECKGGRVDDDSAAVVDGLVNLADDVSLAVGLPELDRMAASRLAAVISRRPFSGCRGR